MSEINAVSESDEDQAPLVVMSRREGPDGRPGELIWFDTGSGPGLEIWVPDPE